MFEFSTVKPVYHQIADWLENEILKGAFKEGERIPSQAAIAQQLHVNPLTACERRFHSGIRAASWKDAAAVSGFLSGPMRRKRFTSTAKTNL